MNTQTQTSTNLRKFLETIHAVHALVESPLSMVFSSALSAAAVSTQGCINVQCPSGEESPVSLFLLVSADSGERKTSTDKHFISVVQKCEISLESCHDFDKIKYESDLSVWKLKERALKNKISHAVRTADDDLLSELSSKLECLLSEKPEPETPFRILYEDTTPAALLSSMNKGWKNVFLNSSEGSIILEKTNSASLPCLNSMWDGSDSRVTRISRPSFVLRDARLSISIMAQKKMFARFLKKGEGVARASGFLARCLIIEPNSTQGYRHNNLSSEQRDHNKKYMDWFDGRMRELLLESMERKTVPRKVLGFTPEAAEIWRNFHDSVEFELRQGGYLSDIRDFASKISNNMARISAVLHYFCGNEGDIGADTATFAKQVCENYIEEFKRLFGYKDPLYVANENALKLHQFLFKKCTTHAMNGFDSNWLLRYGPNPCRNKVDLTAAVTLLHQRGLVFFEPKGRSFLVYLNLHAVNAIPILSPTPSLDMQAHDRWSCLLSTMNLQLAA